MQTFDVEEGNNKTCLALCFVFKPFFQGQLYYCLVPVGGGGGVGR